MGKEEIRAMFGWKSLFHHTEQEERHLPCEFWQGQSSDLFTKFLDSFLGLKKPMLFHSDWVKPGSGYGCLGESTILMVSKQFSVVFQQF